MHRVHARLARYATPATGFQSQPEPRTIGRVSKGRQLTAGNFLLAGYLVEAPGRSMWDLPVPDPSFEEALHGFSWLDDLAAIGEGEAREKAQDWVFGWIQRYGGGRGPGWAPDLAGRRVLRWVNHALFLLAAQDRKASDRFYRSLSQQVVFLSRRWSKTSPGLPRFEALAGLIYAGLALTGMERHVRPAVAALARECVDQIDDEGGLPTRNPEELLEVFTLLTWASMALTEAGHMARPEHLAAIERIAPTLRSLRHADGGLARFHGGGRGQEGVLDTVLAMSGIKAKAPERRAMGFSRISAGRTTVVVDSAAPPKGRASANGHASTCAFELTSGRRPLIVNCGSGAQFGAAWRRAGRATPSHSVLAIEGVSSSRLGAPSMILGREQELLSEAPGDVQINRETALDGQRLQVGHDGWRRTHGLTHARTLDVTLDGRGLAGEDVMTTLSDADKAQFERQMDALKLQGIPLEIRFHLHPEVDAAVDMGGSAVSMALKSGEVWVFRHDATAQMSLEASVYLENGRLKPRSGEQIVLRIRALEYTTRVRWSLAKAQETPLSIRDLQRDDPLGDAET